MYKIIKVETEGGYYLFKLGKLLKDKGITMNQLIVDTETEYIVIKRLVMGNLIRLDLGVLTRICNYLHCTLNDIVEYISY